MAQLVSKRSRPRRSGGRRRLALVGAATAMVVVGAVLAVLLTRDDASAPISAWSATGPDVLEVHVEAGPSDGVLGVDVEEDDAEVRLRVRIDRAESQPQVAVSRTVTVTLDAPLGDRVVLDENGDPVPELP